jgi:hypothetical protein
LYWKLLNESWPKRFFYIRFFYISKVLLQKIIKEILIKKVFLHDKGSFTGNYQRNLDHKGSFTENYWRNLDQKWVIASFRVNFFCNMKKKYILFLWKKMLFLSITIFTPDFYQLATLADENHNFLCKIFD